MNNNRFSYLEEVEGIDALEFVSKENSKTLSTLQSDPNFEKISNDLRDIELSPDRVAWPKPVGNHFYNLWQDETNQRGLWRRTTIESYKSENPVWETILDLDKLALTENENWVWEGSEFLKSDLNLCFISLSRGGKDATVTREFNVQNKSFVKDGFYIPEAKSSVSWIDKNSIYVATELGEESLTDSEYPRIVRLLKRGQTLEESVIAFEIDKEDMLADILFNSKENVHIANRQISFYESENFLLEGNKKILIQMPKDSELVAIWNGRVFYTLMSDLTTSKRTFVAGSVVCLPINKISLDDSLSYLEPVFSPSETSIFASFDYTKDYGLLEVMDKVKGKILRLSLKNEEWVNETLMEGMGSLSVYDADEDTNLIYVHSSDFITPDSLFAVDVSNLSATPELLKSSNHVFNSSDLVMDQRWAKSADGTLVPYFIVHKKDMELNGKNPTLLEGYGGFQTNCDPAYLGSPGKVWCENGGVYVLANIRGGGEFGPQWHQAALREKRHKSFEDFIAIAEDLISTKVTSAKHLGIKGASNGGLLVGAVFTMRPDLFNAVLCQVPLLDMTTYHKFLAGDSWVDEYGDPDDEEMNKFLLTYSPFHNVHPDKKYPEVFFMTSTKDDRVHPVHARKMASLMKELNHSIYYYENFEGGHNGTANIEQNVLWEALEFTYLWKMLK